jgi:hypothetical protein
MRCSFDIDNINGVNYIMIEPNFIRNNFGYYKGDGTFIMDLNVCVNEDVDYCECCQKPLDKCDCFGRSD